jgi:hypothetical protein
VWEYKEFQPRRCDRCEIKGKLQANWPGGGGMKLHIRLVAIADNGPEKVHEIASLQRRLVKVFMRRDCTTGVSRQAVLNNGCHVAHRAQAEQGLGKSRTLFLAWWLRSW